MIIPEQLAKIDELKAKIHAYRPLPGACKIFCVNDFSQLQVIAQSFIKVDQEPIHG